MIFEDFQLQITMWFENHHNTVFDQIFTLFTELGDVTFLLFIFMFVYWNISKKIGLKAVFGMALSFGINTGLKESFKNLRPFYREGITKGLSKEVTGYSFPSGHSQNAGTLWPILMIELKNKWVYIVGTIMLIMVPLSRVYLRVHWIQDVLVGVFLGITIAIVYDKFLSEILLKFLTHPLVITFMTPVSFFAVVLVRDNDVAKGFGVFAGTLYGYWLEMKYVGFQPTGSNRIKLIRFITGAIGLIVLQTVLKYLFNEHVFLDYARYFILGTYITFIAPFIFNKFNLR